MTGLKFAAVVLAAWFACLITPAEAKTQEQITRELEQRGFRILKVRDYGVTFKYTACQGERQVLMFVDTQGAITLKKPRGACPLEASSRPAPTRPRAPKPEQPVETTGPLDERRLKAIAREDGLRRIEITRARPRYLVEGCREGRRFRLNIDRYGRIRRRQSVGDCRKPIDRSQIAGVLAQQGFDQVEILDDRRPPFFAEGCKGNDKFEILLNRFGRIIEQDRMDACRRPLAQGQVLASLRENGLFKIELQQRRRGWLATACDDAEQVALRISAFGEIRRREIVGECQSATMLQVLKTLEARGAIDTVPMVTGCFRGVRYRWLFNRLGERTGRDRVGDCN